MYLRLTQKQRSCVYKEDTCMRAINLSTSARVNVSLKGRLFIGAQLKGAVRLKNLGALFLKEPPLKVTKVTTVTLATISDP